VEQLQINPGSQRIVCFATDGPDNFGKQQPWLDDQYCGAGQTLKQGVSRCVKGGTRIRIPREDVCIKRIHG
jgi:hypothetical protein